jgi:hypothetical protein
MRTVTTSPIQNNENSDQQSDPKSPEKKPAALTVSIILDQTVCYCSHYFGSGCWLLFSLFCIGLVVTVLIILDQVVGYCAHYFGSGLLVSFPVILDQTVAKIMRTVTNSLIQNNGNSNQQPDPKSPEQ